MQLSDFDYTLPENLIATRPADPRDSARLLCSTPQAITHHIVRDLPQLLRPGDMLVFNDTRVIPARLFGRRGAAKIEVLLHKAVNDYAWEVYAKPAKRLKAGDEIIFSDQLHAHVAGKNAVDGTVMLQFNQTGDSFKAALEAIGSTPLPPYIQRSADAADKHDYQTMFAAADGAVAAPTASLHYTPALMQALADVGIQWCTITLHVGAGTFMPVRVENIAEHVMHAERCMVSAATAEKINATRKAGGRIIAVGTTAMRTLESAADALGMLHPIDAETRLFITPGYQFKITQGLLTNFHLPKSTLLMLVGALVGMQRLHQIYTTAIADNYRFYSYGDTSLLWPQQN